MGDESEGSWADGTCKTCGGAVIEKPDMIGRKDYMNKCTSEECPNNEWHSCYDDEQLEYYDHAEG